MPQYWERVTQLQAQAQADNEGLLESTEEQIQHLEAQIGEENDSRTEAYEKLQGVVADVGAELMQEIGTESVLRKEREKQTLTMLEQTVGRLESQRR